MDASIVVATKDRGPDIKLTIESLVALDYPCERYEVIIVDNMSNPENQKHLQGFQSTYPGQVLYVREEKIGLSNARNSGIASSRGDIILFIDDDAIAPSFWLKNILRAFKDNSDVYALGSKVISRFTSPPPEWLDERLGIYISNFDHGDKIIELHYNEYPRGTNMAFLNKTFKECGLFLDCFGRKGNSMMSYEEIELCYRVEKAGHKILYIPDAEIYHLIRGNRINIKWYYNRFYWQGRSEGLFELIHYGRKYVFKKSFFHLKKSFTRRDGYDRRFHRGFFVAILINFFHLRFD